MAYRWHTGSIAWVIQRTSGVVLTLYIFAHLYVLSSLKDPERFDAIMAAMKSPAVMMGEAGLLMLVIAHMFNGIRVSLLELGVSGRHQKGLFWVAFAAGVVVVVAGTSLLLGGTH